MATSCAFSPNCFFVSLQSTVNERVANGEPVSDATVRGELGQEIFDNYTATSRDPVILLDRLNTAATILKER